MNRIERCEEKYRELFGEFQPSTLQSDPDFHSIIDRFVFGEVYYQGDLDVKTRELINLSVLTVNQTLPQLHAQVTAALNVGLTPVEIN